jgi:hypothetical protein
MKDDTLKRLDQMFAESPILRAEEAPTENEIDEASNAVGIPFSKDFREFLARYGGATVGPYPVFGLRPSEVMDDRWSVVEVTKEVRASGIEGIDGWVIVSEDHSGNPVGMDGDGKVWIYDHDFGGVSELAPSFEEYLRTQCLNIAVSE